MPPKRAKKPTPRNGSTPVASADEGLDPEKPVIYFEHCRSCHTFGQRAVEIHSTLQERGLKQLQLQINAIVGRAPRRGSFEISLALRPTAEATELWSGLKRTPRSKKWPNTHALYEQIVVALKKKQDQEQKEEQKEEKKEEPKTKEKPKAAATPKTPKKRKADTSDNLEPRSTRSMSAKRSKKSSPKKK